MRKIVSRDVEFCGCGLLWTVVEVGVVSFHSVQESVCRIRLTPSLRWKFFCDDANSQFQ
jgi:hypothetical protein